MPTYNAYASGGRELMIKFTCRRCHKVAYAKLKDCERDDDYGWLHNTKIPIDWGEVCGGLMCDECYPQYLKFINGEDHNG